MREFVGIIGTLFLVIVALGLATSLHWYRRHHDRLRWSARRQGQSILAEVPTDSGLALFTENIDAFYWSGHAIRKDQIKATRVLINGVPIAVSVSRRFAFEVKGPSTEFPEQPDDISRDRWDVEIETSDQTVLVECGTIREHISQDLARRVFDAVKTEIDSRNKPPISSQS